MSLRQNSDPVSNCRPSVNHGGLLLPVAFDTPTRGRDLGSDTKGLDRLWNETERGFEKMYNLKSSLRFFTVKSTLSEVYISGVTF